MLDSLFAFLSVHPEYILGAAIAGVVFAMMQLNHRNNIELEDKRTKSEEKRAENITKNHNEWQKFIEEINEQTTSSVKDLSSSVSELAKMVSTQSIETGSAVKGISAKIDTIHADIVSHKDDFKRFASDVLDRERRGGTRL